jgi:NAD(P)-dependent dehydrogenase (short-subunit alcohol dehydrogenase family)
MTGSGSFVKDPEDEWQRVFDVCWGGVYNNTRAFLPALQNAPEARLVNMSSANGFFASVGPGMPHTSYSAAKFAVKGFTEALIEDLRERRDARARWDAHLGAFRRVWRSTRS